MNRRFELQPLEARRLLSAGEAFIEARPDVRVPFVECAEVVEARAEAADVMRQLRAEKRNGMLVIRQDQLAIRGEFQELIEEKGADTVQDALAPLREKLREDTRLKSKELRAVAEELRIAKRSGRQLIAADMEALREANASGDAAAIEAAREKLAEDRAKIQEDLKPIRDRMLEIKQAKRELLAADHAAIQAKLEELNPDLAPLYDQLAEHAAALEAKLQSALAAVTDANEALRQAIADCRAENTAGEAGG